MIDYFALLDQPHLPWLDPDELKNTYHRTRTLKHTELPPALRTRPLQV